MCQKISDGLHKSIKGRKFCISVHQCESIADVVKTRIDISVDFIIFAFDSRAAHTLSEVRDINLYANYLLYIVLKILSFRVLLFVHKLLLIDYYFKVEANIAILDEYYIISGVTCLVNCNGVFNVMGLIHKSKKLCHKYNIRYLSANVFVSLQIRNYMGYS